MCVSQLLINRLIVSIVSSVSLLTPKWDYFAALPGFSVRARAKPSAIQTAAFASVELYTYFAPQNRGFAPPGGYAHTWALPLLLHLPRQSLGGAEANCTPFGDDCAV